MRRLGLLACVAGFLVAVPLAASAQSAFVLRGADIYAGPGSDYPIVARLAPGVGVRVQGCLGDYSWCDVTFGPNRGWVYAGQLGYPYRSSRVPIIDYGPQLALPIITFSLGNYWDRYYRARPWYRERNDWDRRWRDGVHDGRNDWRGGRDNRGRGDNNWRDRERDDRGDRGARGDRGDRGDRRSDYRSRSDILNNPRNEGNAGYTLQPGRDPQREWERATGDSSSRQQ